MLEAWIEHLSGTLNELETNLEIERLDKIIELLGGDKNALKTNLVSERITIIYNLITGEQKEHATLDDLIEVFAEQAKAEVTGTSITVNDSTSLPASLEITDNVGGTAYIKVCNKNLLNMSELFKAGDEILEDSLGSFSHCTNVLRLKLKPNTAYTLSSDGKGSSDGVANTNRCLYFNATGLSMVVYKNHPVTTATDENGNIYIAFFANRAIAQPILNGEVHVQLEEGIKTNYVPHEEQNYEIQAEVGNKLTINTYNSITHINAVGSTKPTMKLNYKKIIE